MRVRTLDAKAEASAVSNKNAISLARVSNIGNPSHVSSFTKRKNAMNRIVQLHNYLFKNNNQYFIRSVLIVITIIVFNIIIAIIMVMFEYMGGNLENYQEEKRWDISYFNFIFRVIIVPIIAGLLIVMIFKISDSFFKNKEIIPLTIIPFIAGFSYTFFLPAFVEVFIVLYQYVCIEKTLQTFIHTCA